MTDVRRMTDDEIRSVLTWLEPDWECNNLCPDPDLILEQYERACPGMVRRALREIDEADAPCVSPI